MNGASSASPTSTPSGATAFPDARRSLVKVGLLLALVLAGTLARRFTPLRDWFEPAGRMAEWVRQTGGVGIAVFFSGSAVLVFLGVPRLLFCPIAGALFGFWLGLGLCLSSAGVSYFLAFLLVRGRGLADEPPPLPRTLAFLGRDPGFTGVVLARLVPLPGMVVTLALSLTRVGRRKYLLGTLVGMAPEAAPLVLLGAGILRADQKSLPHFGLVLLLLAAIFWLTWRQFHRRQAKRRQAEASRANPV